MATSAGRPGQGSFVALALVALAVCAALAWLLTSPAGSADPLEDLALETPPAALSAMDLRALDAPGVAPVAPLEVPAPAASTDASAAATGASTVSADALVVGRLLSPEGRPVADAEVFYVPSESSQRALDLQGGVLRNEILWERLSSARSGPDGRFELVARDLPPILAGEEPFLVRAPSVSVRAAGFELASHRCPRPQPPGRFDLGDLRLVPGAQVTGRVVDEHGRPVSGAVLAPPSFLFTAFSRSLGRQEEWRRLAGLCRAESGSDGRFAFTSLWEGRLDVRVSAAGFAPRGMSFEARQDEPHDVGDVVLTRGGTIAGLVVDDKGAPLPDVVVFGRPAQIPGPSGSDAALASFQVRMMSAHAAEVHTRSDAEGRFVLADLPASRWTVLAGDDEREPALVDAVEPDVHDLLLVVREAGSILLDVRDARTDLPLRDARAEGTRFSGTSSSPWDATLHVHRGADALHPRLGARADEDGLVLLIPTGRRNAIRVEAPGYAPQQLMIEDAVAPTRVERVVHLTRGARVLGRVVDEDGALVPEAQVTFQAQADAPGAEAIEELSPEFETDEQGAFEIENAAPGVALLRASKDGFLPSELLELDVPEEGDAEAVLRLRRAARLEGIVFDAGGAPAPDVRISAQLDLHGEPAFGLQETTVVRAVRTTRIGFRDRHATSDADGRFTFEALPAGNYTVSAHPGGLAQVEAVADETRHVTLRLRPQPVLEGLLLDARGPVRGAEITVHALDGFAVLAAFPVKGRTDAQGRFRFVGDLAAGAILVAARVGEAWSSVEKVTLAWGESAFVQLRMGTGAISGVVRDAESGAPLHRASVRVQPRSAVATNMSGLFSARLTCDAEGRFAAGDLAFGEHVLTASASERLSSEPMDVTLTPDAPAQDLTLELRRGAVLDLRVLRPAGAEPRPLSATLTSQRVPRLLGRLAPSTSRRADTRASPASRTASGRWSSRTAPTPSGAQTRRGRPWRAARSPSPPVRCTRNSSSWTFERRREEREA